MIKAIIFDCFGVLTTESFDAFRNEYFPQDSPKCQAANMAMDRLNAAQISYGEFLRVLAGLSGLTPEKVERYLSQNTSNKPLFEYIRTVLKPKYKIGLLSNAGANWLNDLFSKEDLELIDDAVLSYEHRIIKPHPEIFRLAAKRLGVETDECVFVDDHQKHCKGAVEAGMQAIRYLSFRQMRNDLEKLLK